MTSHVTKIDHLRNGWKRWLGRCCCGWACAPCSEEEAAAAVAEHLASVGATTETTEAG